MADMTAKREQLSSSYRPHHGRVTQQCVCVCDLYCIRVWVSNASEQGRQHWCGQCGRDESQGQTEAAFQGRGKKKRRREEKVRESEIKEVIL